MTQLDVALFNYEDGGLRSLKVPGFVRSQGWEFTSLQRAFSHVDHAPELILLNETNDYGYYGGVGLMAAADALSEQLGRIYEARLGYCERGDYGPAFFYDPQVIRLQSWGDSHHTVYEHWRNIAICSLRSRRSTEFRVSLHHWSGYSIEDQVKEARKFDHLAVSDTPCLLGGDLNATVSGHHLPQRDWSVPNVRVRQHTGWQPAGPGTSWAANTKALDHLIGWWDKDRQCRQDSVGFFALAELAWQQGMPADQALIPTLNHQAHRGGGLLIDWLLVNEPWKAALIPDSYRVHVPEGNTRADFPSNHRLVTAALDI